ncbi:hypothetical protein Tco_1135981 [Tanacetum coccineum]
MKQTPYQNQLLQQLHNTLSENRFQFFLSIHLPNEAIIQSDGDTSLDVTSSDEELTIMGDISFPDSDSSSGSISDSDSDSYDYLSRNSSKDLIDAVGCNAEVLQPS